MSALPPRMSRVQFEHPVRIAALEGPPRIIRTLTSDLSLNGAFVRMPEPLAPGTRVAMSLEAAGQTFPLVEGSVRWVRAPGPRQPGGFGMQFDRFLHPRGVDLVASLVDSLERGLPLQPAPAPSRWVRPAAWAAGVVALAALLVGAVWLWPPRAGAPAGAVAQAEVQRGPAVADPGPMAPVDTRSTAAAALVGGPAARDPGAPVEASPDGTPAAGTSTTVVAPTPPARDPGPSGSEVAPPATPESAAGAAGSPVDAPRRSGAPERPTRAVAPSSPAAAGQAARTGPAFGAPLPRLEPRVLPPQRATTAAPVPPPAVRPLARASSAAPGAPERAPGAGVGSPDGQVSLRSGAASSVTWSLRGNELRIAPVLRQGQVRRSFFLSSPPRVVFDVEGLAPASNTVTEASGPSVSRVRVGAQGTATRVVVDLVRPPRRATSVDAAMVLTYPDP